MEQWACQLNMRMSHSVCCELLRAAARFILGVCAEQMARESSCELCTMRSGPFRATARCRCMIGALADHFIGFYQAGRKRVV